jgi:hypothetical protein
MVTPVFQGAPGLLPAQCRNVLKNHFPFIQIKLIGNHIAGKVNIVEPVAVHITHCNATAIVKIFIHQHVGIQSFGQCIGKINFGLVSGAKRVKSGGPPTLFFGLFRSEDFLQPIKTSGTDQNYASC